MPDDFLVREGEAGPYCPIRYIWLEKMSRATRYWVPLVVPDVPELNRPFGVFVWLGVIPAYAIKPPDELPA